MLILGERNGKIGLAMPSVMLSDSVPGKTYELHITTDGVATDEKQFAKELIMGLYGKFKAKVVYLSVDSGSVMVQLEGSPFTWAAVIAWLPTVLTLFGLTLIGIAVFAVLVSIPSWAWVALIIGGILVVASPSIGKVLGVK